MTDLSTLTEVELRNVWPHEAQNFTPWLRDNSEHLAKALHIDLTLDSIEHKVGSYSLDVIGRDLTNGCTLIVENQLTETDHGHLGQLLTYAAGTDAKTVVWVASIFRPEHRQAIDYLNSVTSDDARFFGVEVKVVRIDDSRSAPLFTLVAFPNDWHAKTARMARSAIAGGLSGRYQEFWTEYLERLHADFPQHTNVRSAQPQNWLNVNYRRRGHIVYVMAFGRNETLRAEVYIDSQDGDENLDIFQSFLAQRAQIEAEYGAPLAWEELPDRRACKIYASTHGSIDDESKRQHQIDWMLDQHQRLWRVFDHRIAALGDGR